jgi:hypothetical protein
VKYGISSCEKGLACEILLHTECFDMQDSGVFYLHITGIYPDLHTITVALCKVIATPKKGKKISKLVCSLTETTLFF